MSDDQERFDVAVQFPDGSWESHHGVVYGIGDGYLSIVGDGDSTIIIPLAAVRQARITTA